MLHCSTPTHLIVLINEPLLHSYVIRQDNNIINTERERITRCCGTSGQVMDYLRVQDVTLLPDMCTGEKLLEYLKIRYENDVIYVRKCFHLHPS